MITPLEIRQQKFRNSFRGYDREAVDAFLTALSQEWERQLELKRNLQDELEQLRGRYDTLKEVEDMLHKTLIQAEQSARDTLENARQKADIRIREAELKAREMVQKGVEERNT
ncbi:MAG: DivIVA domain-containing protein, partial [Bacteroidetes bacterium]